MLKPTLPSLLLTASLLASPTLAQSPSTPAAVDSLLQLSPQAAYTQAVLPVEIVHRSVSNWSPAETTALAVAVTQAQAFCNARPAAKFSGADLLGLARLCTLGQQWPAVLDASNRLLASLPNPSPTPPSSTTTPDPSPRAQALAFKIEAALNLHDPSTALAAGRALLTSETYTPLVQQSTTSLLTYLQLIQTGDALDLAAQRLDRILPLLRSATSTPPANTTSSPNTIPAHELYTAALAAPTLLQLEANTPAAAQTLATIEAAVPSHLPLDESTLIALARRHYALLGSPLPSVAAAVSLFSPGETPRINPNFGASTVLLVFPDWCAQCVRLAQSGLMPFLTRHAGDDIHLYGLLAQPQPPPVPAPPAVSRHSRHDPPSREPTPSTPTTAADQLRGTPTLVVASSVLLATFATTDAPLLVVTDHTGNIRYTGIAPENAFVPGGLVDQAVARVLELWPPHPKR